MGKSIVKKDEQYQEGYADASEWWQNYFDLEHEKSNSYSEGFENGMEGFIWHLEDYLDDVEYLKKYNRHKPINQPKKLPLPLENITDRIDGLVFGEEDDK